jgi:cell shape-determining protein MreC
MTNRNRYFLGILIIVLAAFAVLAPTYGFRLRNFLSPPATGPAGQTDTANLAAQNEQLLAQLAKLQVVASQLPSASSSEIRAMVYSRYPLNFKSEILIDAGTQDSVSPGKAVLFQGVLIGTINSVFADGSTVQTVFDPNFRMPVRIGSAGVDGLFQGGAEPAVVSIAKDVTIQPGDIIYSAAPGIPYALPIGQVGDVSVAANNLFQQATVNFVYDINSVQTVLILNL